MKNSTVYNQDQIRLYIPFRRYLELEDILIKKEINYSIDFHMPNSIADFVRFYFDKKDAKLIDHILIENGIQSTDDFFMPSDFEKEQKIFLLYAKFFGLLLLLVFVTYVLIN